MLNCGYIHCVLTKEVFFLALTKTPRKLLTFLKFVLFFVGIKKCLACLLTCLSWKWRKPLIGRVSEIKAFHSVVQIERSEEERKDGSKERAEKTLGQHSLQRYSLISTDESFQSCSPPNFILINNRRRTKKEGEERRGGRNGRMCNETTLALN